MQCQLYAGHEGDHAAVRAEQGERLLPRWSTGLPIVEMLFADATHQLPWAPGCPRDETYLTTIGAVESAAPKLTIAESTECPIALARPAKHINVA